MPLHRIPNLWDRFHGVAQILRPPSCHHCPSGGLQPTKVGPMQSIRHASLQTCSCIARCALVIGEASAASAKSLNVCSAWTVSHSPSPCHPSLHPTGNPFGRLSHSRLMQWSTLINSRYALQAMPPQDPQQALRMA